MQVQLLGTGSAVLGTYMLVLNRTALSIYGGADSNSEGLFIAPIDAPVSAVRLTNFGDATTNGSRFDAGRVQTTRESPSSQIARRTFRRLPC
jgi:hypothetical protein